jgi:hypothetical protein
MEIAWSSRIDRVMGYLQKTAENKFSRNVIEKSSLNTQNP